jgi:hypothetical protein
MSAGPLHVRAHGSAGADQRRQVSAPLHERRVAASAAEERPERSESPVSCAGRRESGRRLSDGVRKGRTGSHPETCDDQDDTS